MSMKRFYTRVGLGIVCWNPPKLTCLISVLEVGSAPPAACFLAPMVVAPPVYYRQDLLLLIIPGLKSSSAPCSHLSSILRSLTGFTLVMVLSLGLYNMFLWKCMYCSLHVSFLEGKWEQNICGGRGPLRIAP